jgi:hypothetical protein
MHSLGIPVKKKNLKKKLKMKQADSDKSGNKKISILPHFYYRFEACLQ